MKILLIIISACILVLAGCSGNNTTGGAITDTDNLNNCNDNNICTNDLSADGKCSYTEIKPCCGNNVCEPKEGCDSISKMTSCKKDCATCPAEVSVIVYGCDGNCVKNLDGSITVKGDSTLSFEAENSGEEDIKVSGEFSCSRASSTSTVKLSYYGLSEKGYFENGVQNEVTLKGKSKEKYLVALTGRPNMALNLDCNIYINAGPNINLEFFNLKLEK